MHWKVIEPERNIRRCDYLTYPCHNTASSSFRHEWVMVLQARPFVPQPGGAPMPTKSHTVEERTRILSVYLRPWVLSRYDVSTHVPHLTELNTVRQWKEITRAAVRKRCKTTPVTPQRCNLYVIYIYIYLYIYRLPPLPPSSLSSMIRGLEVSRTRGLEES